VKMWIEKLIHRSGK